MYEISYVTPGESTESGSDAINGLNDAEFISLINDPAYLSLFLSNPENLNILTPEQLNIIQDYV